MRLGRRRRGCMRSPLLSALEDIMWGEVDHLADDPLTAAAANEPDTTARAQPEFHCAGASVTSEPALSKCIESDSSLLDASCGPLFLLPGANRTSSGGVVTFRLGGAGGVPALQPAVRRRADELPVPQNAPSSTAEAQHLAGSSDLNPVTSHGSPIRPAAAAVEGTSTDAPPTTTTLTAVAASATTTTATYGNTTDTKSLPAMHSPSVVEEGVQRAEGSANHQAARSCLHALPSSASSRTERADQATGVEHADDGQSARESVSKEHASVPAVPWCVRGGRGERYACTHPGL